MTASRRRFHIYARPAIQDHTKHTANICQNFLRENLGRGGFIFKIKWPSSSPDCNPMDYHFWNVVETKVYEEQREPFNNFEGLKPAVKRAWRVVFRYECHQISYLTFLPKTPKSCNSTGRTNTAHFRLNNRLNTTIVIFIVVFLKLTRVEI